MKKRIRIFSVFILMVCFLEHNFSQKNINYSACNSDWEHINYCQFDYKNNELPNPILYNLDSINKAVVENVTNYLNKQFDSLFHYVGFIKAQELRTGSHPLVYNFKKYYNKRQNDEANYFYHIPKYEFLFKFNIPQLEIKYCFSIHTDSMGKIIGDVFIPKIKKRKYNFVSKIEVINIAESKWENKTDNIEIYFAYHKKKKYFVWVLSRFIDFKLGIIQRIIINANSGRIIKNEKFKLSLE